MPLLTALTALTSLRPLLTLHLPAAQRSWQPLPRGAEIMVAEGAVCVHRREYLAGLWVDAPLLLRAGERQRLAAGWVEIEALAAARVVVSTRSRWTWPAALARLCFGRTARSA
ncbi:hypothetical protein SAMN05216303_103421 [Rhodoferax sp. OV413]|uniref:hypothetical protein n=1 Tax=Rhodoferax sp. OV413 TaxID=1855285 RepID=UPI000891FFD3|nr:hypothetical protein [Rhodoferax sp. OV413]SDP22765.1 hypothetical protein SAMN05216303_103421 [Rhodoferax sp. OV413]